MLLSTRTESWNRFGTEHFGLERVHCASNSRMASQHLCGRVPNSSWRTGNLRVLMARTRSTPWHLVAAGGRMGGECLLVGWRKRVDIGEGRRQDWIWSWEKGGMDLGEGCMFDKDDGMGRIVCMMHKFTKWWWALGYMLMMYTANVDLETF